MKPDDRQDDGLPAAQVPAARSYLSTPPSRDPNYRHRDAAADVVRDQIDTIYSTTQHPGITPSAQQPVAAAAESPAHSTSQDTAIDDANPYDRTQTNHATIDEDQWKQYHSSWQKYYQQYYERYYVGAVQQHVATQPQDALAGQAEDPADTISQDEALNSLRGQLRSQISNSARSVRKSRHFMPIAAALCVLMVFLFLQYNRVLFAGVEAYVRPGSVDPASIIVNPSSLEAVGDESLLVIPKINVNVPIVFDTTPDHNAQMKAMEEGVAWFGIPGANSKPGQIGNTVLSGHSSNDIFDSGDHKFVFARLDQLREGDNIYVNYEGVRHTYTVTNMEVVRPTEVNKLIYPTDKPVLTLITCTPLGTTTNRLLVTAEQVTPSPVEAAPAPEGSGSDSNGESPEIPGNTPSFLQRVFGG